MVMSLPVIINRVASKVVHKPLKFNELFCLIGFKGIDIFESTGGLALCLVGLTLTLRSVLSSTNLIFLDVLWERKICCHCDNFATRCPVLTIGASKAFMPFIW
jgi:hypothetical protein